MFETEQTPTNAYNCMKGLTKFTIYPISVLKQKTQRFVTWNFKVEPFMSLTPHGAI